MSADDDPIAAVERWRAQRAGGVDPVRLGIVEALARRAGAMQGDARALVLQRIDALLVDPPATQPTGTGLAVPAPAARRAVLATLSELVDRLGRTPTTPRTAPARTGASATTATAAARSPSAVPASLKSVTAHKGTWSRLRAEQRLRQALAQVPANSGPLNSSHVTNRTLQALRELSPEYLDAFMRHVDTLLWLEQASGAGDLGAALREPRRPRVR